MENMGICWGFSMTFALILMAWVIDMQPLSDAAMTAVASALSSGFGEESGHWEIVCLWTEAVCSC